MLLKVMGRQQLKKRKDDGSITLGDMLNEQMMKKLKNKKKDLTAQEKDQQEAEEERKRKERIEREKNKSFEELLSESELDWKDFK